MKTELIPVIHKVSFEQLCINVKVCIDCGVSKIFLIDHTSEDTHEQLLKDAITIKEKYGIWVGVNMLQLTTTQALTINSPIDAIWCDGVIPTSEINKRIFKGQFFGSLAFKYQKQPTDLEEACKEAVATTDVATTSGPGTGKAAAIEKINTLRGFLKDHPMAIASGVSLDNIDSYLGKVNYLLVASSITNLREIIEKTALTQLMDKINKQ